MSDLSYMGGKGYSRGTDESKECYNQYTGKKNEGQLINKGRGPTKGNDGTKSYKGAPSMVADTHAKGAYGKAPYRGVGGTTVSSMKSNYGRGPTKGNQQ